MVEYFSFMRDRLKIYYTRNRKVALKVSCQKRKFINQGSIAWGHLAIKDTETPYVYEFIASDHFDFLDESIYFV